MRESVLPWLTLTQKMSCDLALFVFLSLFPNAGSQSNNSLALYKTGKNMLLDSFNNCLQSFIWDSNYTREKFRLKLDLIHQNREQK